MGQYVVVTSQVSDDLALKAALEVRSASPRSGFFFVVAAVPPRHEPSAWSLGYRIDEGLGDQDIRAIVEEDNRRRGAEQTQARHEARQRLTELSEYVQRFGAHADGIATAEDPVGAVHEILADRHVDEIIVALAPTPFPRWLRRGLSARLAALGDARVTTIQPGAAPLPGFDGHRAISSLIRRR